jgi:hypothetical protein
VSKSRLCITMSIIVIEGGRREGRERARARACVCALGCSSANINVNTKSLGKVKKWLKHKRHVTFGPETV